jgi:hypothetical protein
MRTNNCQSAEQQQSATTQRLPVKQRCVVKLHREDEGVVLRIQLVIDDDLSIEFVAHHSIIGVRGDQEVLRRKCVAVLEVRRTSASQAKGLCRFQPKPTPTSDLYCEWLTCEQALALVRHLL